MNISVITIFPEIFDAIKNYGITSRAIENNLINLDLINPRDFTSDNYKRVDDRPYGGGPGMVMLAEPMLKAIEFAKKKITEKISSDKNDLNNKKIKVIHLSPRGKKITQKDIELLSRNFIDDLDDLNNLKEENINNKNNIKNIIFIASRYEGLDQRVIDLAVDEEWSIGDYIISGGELAAMVVIDSISRLLPGVLGDSNSYKQDSFSKDIAGILDCSHYTRPEVIEYKGSEYKVPDVLLSGNHEEIDKWRFSQKMKLTKDLRPDLLETNLV